MLTRLARMPGGHRLAFWILILLALGLRLACLAFQPLWWDEGWSLYFATTDVGAMLQLTAVDIHPPLYYLLLHLWIGLLGSSVISVRLLSVLIGTAMVPLLYVTGRQLLGERGGLLAAFLLAISPFQIYYAQEVRMYGLVTLLGLAALYLAIRWWPEAAGRRWGVWLGYVLVAAAALYAEYYALFLILALNLGVLARWRRERRPLREIGSWLSAQAVVMALYLPWLAYAGGKLWTYVRFKVSVEQDPPLDLFTYLGRHLSAFGWGHAEGLLANWWWLGLLPLAVMGLALVLLFWQRPRRQGIRDWIVGTGIWPLVVLVGSLVCGFVVNLLFPFAAPRSERVLLLAQPAYLLLVAAALLALWRARRWPALWSGALVCLLSLASLSFFYSVPRYPDDDYRTVAARIQALGSGSDAIVCIQPWQVGYFQAYLPGDARPTLFLTPRQVLPRERQLWAADPALMAADLDALLAEHGRLWFPAHQLMGLVLERPVEAYLAGHAYPVLREWHGESTVLSFFATGRPVVQPVTARFGEWLSLDSAALSPGPLESGRDLAAVDLGWTLSWPPTSDYTVGLRLVGKTGHVWAQRDSPPGGGLAQFREWSVDGSYLDRHGLWVPAGTPPGEYRVTLRVYRSGDVAVLPVTFEGGSGGEVTLGAVQVVRPATPPPVEALAFEQPLRVDFGRRLRLLGATVAGDRALLPGEAVEVELFWQALADPGEDFLPRLQLLDGAGRVVAQLAEKPVAGTYPTAWWRAGELVRDPHALPIPAAVPPGRYHLATSLVRAAGDQPVEIQRGQPVVDLAEIEVRGREHRFEPAAPGHSQAASFGPSVELVGYDLQGVPVTPGSGLEVTLYWHALDTPDRNYHTFVHLLDGAGNIVTQHDGPPGAGELPTLGWLPGEYLTDPHVLQLPPDLPQGEYRLGVGLYDPKTWQRLGERIILDTSFLVANNP